MFKIDETSGGVSVTDTFNANDLPINEIVLYIKAFQIDKPNDRYGTVNLKLSYDYNKEPPVFNVNVKQHNCKQKSVGVQSSNQQDLHCINNKTRFNSPSVMDLCKSE